MLTEASFRAGQPYVITDCIISQAYDKVYKKRLTPHTRCDIISELSRTACGLVAQLDRVFDYESKGRGFESRRAHQMESVIYQRFPVFIFARNKAAEKRLWVLVGY